VRVFTAILYLLAALATLIVCLADFDSLCRIILPIHFRWLAASAIGIFAIPAIFLLAGFTAFVVDKPKAPPWITVAITFAALMPILISRRHGVLLFAEVAGPIASIVVILAFSGLKPSKIAGIAACIYAVAEGPGLVSFLEGYFSPRTTGNSFQHFLTEVIPAVLVIASLTTATASIVRHRKRMTDIPR
jgi:hypothetical protein